MNAAPKTSPSPMMPNAAVIGSSVLLEHEIKTCTKCKARKPASLFYKNKNKKDGRTEQCADCLRTASAQYQRKNKAECLKRSQMWRDKNRPRTRAYAKTWAKNNPERRRENQNVWARTMQVGKKRYTANRQAILAKKKRERETVSDDYVRQQMTGKSPVLSQADIPQSLVKLKAKIIKLRRLCKQKK